MVKILFLFGGIPQRGGTEAVMANIYNMIDKEKFAIDFLFFGNQEDDKSEFTESIKRTSRIFYVPVLRAGIHKNHRAIKKILKENHYDIVHSHMDASGTDVLRIAKRCGVKLRIAHSHNTGHLENAIGIKQKLHKVYLDIARRQLPNFATHFIACSSLAGRWLFGEKICGCKEKYMLFRNAIDVERYNYDVLMRENVRNELGIKNEKVIGHVGRFDYQKNHSYLIDIFAQVHAKNDNTKLVLIGEGKDMPVIKEKVNALGLKDFVLFLGGRDNVNELLQAFDIFVFPSYYEGLSIALVEAETSGLKCLVSDSTTTEADISGNVEFLNIGAEPEIWAERILEIFDEKIERVSPIERIRKSGFDIRTNIKDLEKFYIRALKNETPRSRATGYQPGTHFARH